MPDPTPSPAPAPAPTPAPSPAPAPSPTPSPAPAPAPSPAPAPAPEAWYKPFNLDQAGVDYINAKGIKDAGGIIKVAQDFEKVARERNVIAKPDTSDPKKLAEWEGWKELGWVEDPAKYTPKKPALKEGQFLDEGIFNAFAKTAHELRIPLPQAEALYGKMFEQMHDQVANAAGEQKKEQQTKLDKGIADLKTEWGGKYDANMELSKRAISALGFAKENAALIEQIAGFPALAKAFQVIGEKLGEDFLKGGGGGGSQMGPAQARTARLKLESDAEWMAIFNDQRHGLHQDHVDERQRLIALEAKGK